MNFGLLIIGDAKKFNVKYNPQFYTKEISLKANKIIYDILFLGQNKKREEKILKIKYNLNKKFLKTNFIIVKKEKDFIKYSDYLELLSKSRCILDYNQEGQKGLSLRPLESLFFEKKLITNNKDIQNYDFYNKDNIFILGIDNMDNIEEFINKPYTKIDRKIIDRYEFKNWLSRF